MRRRDRERRQRKRERREDERGEKMKDKRREERRWKTREEKMKEKRQLQIDPSTVCVIDAKSAFDHLVRESTGGHCRRTAQELCVIRRSMQTLRARCRWVPHERMVVDALTKRHGNSVTMLRLLRDGVLSIVDEDRELAMRKVYRETHKRNLRPHQQVEQAKTGEYDQAKRRGLFSHDQGR